MVARAFAATGLVIVRADSAYYAREVIAAATWAGAKFSITARMTPLVRAPISSTDDDAWVPSSYPNAIFDNDEQQCISDAEIAVTADPTTQQVSGRLIVRRVKRLNPAGAGEQAELFSAYRYHSVFTDSPLILVQAEKPTAGTPSSNKSSAT